MKSLKGFLMRNTLSFTNVYHPSRVKNFQGEILRNHAWCYQTELLSIIIGWTQGLSQDFKNACPKQQFLNFCPSRLSYLSTSNPYNSLHLIAKCVKKVSLHFSYVQEDGLLGKYLVITPQKLNLKNHHRKFCLSKQEVFRKLPVQKTGRTGDWLSPWMDHQTS